MDHVILDPKGPHICELCHCPVDNDTPGLWPTIGIQIVGTQYAYVDGGVRLVYVVRLVMCGPCAELEDLLGEEAEG